jgi:hypothetical protein
MVMAQTAPASMRPQPENPIMTKQLTFAEIESGLQLRYQRHYRGHAIQVWQWSHGWASHFISRSGGHQSSLAGPYQSSEMAIRAAKQKIDHATTTGRDLESEEAH